MLKTKEQKAITLISLVITIIILLILAGVAINLSLGKNGIFTKAKEAREKMEKATLIEQIQTEILEKQLDNNGGSISKKDLEDILSKYGEVKKDEEGNITGVKTNKGKHDITLEEILSGGEVKGPTQTPDESQGKNINKITLNNKTINLEVGNKTILTITIEPEDAENKEVEWTSDNEGIIKVNAEGEITAISEGIAKITVSSKNNNTINDECTVTVTKSKGVPGESGYLGGDYNDPYIPTGFTHTEGTWNSGYTIKGIGEEIAPDEFVWVPCVLTAEEQNKAKKDGYAVEIYKKTLPTTTYNTDPYYLYNARNETIIGDLEEANYLKESVGKYGGFYMGKYEAGVSGTVANYNLSTKKPIDGSFKPLSQPDKGVWNYISATGATTVAKAMIDYEKTGVHSCLPSGEAWDTTLQWMVNSSDNKTSNGKYDISFGVLGYFNTGSNAGPHTTGYYAVNNIYDMKANIEEYTMEKCLYNSTQERLISRGTNYGADKTKYTTASRGASNQSSQISIGFRCVIYK